ncbi:hypothetical protein RB195_022179 [Necator americanus]|uniref:Uncharacterized protein n=1 Tax=Necator americanus TaxID=51031 RepID=A0ABR1EEI7_NECAM
MKEDLRTLGVDGQFWRDVRFRWIWNSDEWIDSVPLSQNIEKVEQSYVRERWHVFTGRAGPSMSSIRFLPSSLSSKMFSSFVSDVDEVLEPNLAELSIGPFA